MVILNTRLQAVAVMVQPMKRLLCSVLFYYLAIILHLNTAISSIYLTLHHIVVWLREDINTKGRLNSVIKFFLKVLLNSPLILPLEFV